MSDKSALASVDFQMRESVLTKNLTILFFGGEPLLRFDLMYDHVKLYLMQSDQ